MVTMLRKFGIHNRLTELSNHYIDWSRVGELLQSTSHRYDKNQFLVRAFITSGVAVSAYLGYYFNNEEKTGCSNTIFSVATGFISFTFLHTIVVLPLIMKRHAMGQACARLVEDIRQLSENDVNLPFKNTIGQVVQEILEFSLSDAHHSRASETWGRRKNLLEKFKSLLASSEVTHRQCLQEDKNIILQILNEYAPHTAQTCRL